VDAENETRVSKGLLKKSSQILQQRHALGSLSGNNGRVEEQHAFKKPTLLPPTLQRQPLAPLKSSEVGELQKDDPGLEDMEVNNMADAFSDQLSIEDIDQDDFENPQLCADYVKDIYRYLRHLEQKYHVDPMYMKNQPEINERMRLILIDWLIQVHLKFSLFQETLYLTISIIDRYLEVVKVKKHDLQLVGVTAMLIASKYEEMYAPEVKDFVYITDNTYSAEQIRVMERDMMYKLEYVFGNPLPLHFLRRNSKAAEVTPEMHTMAKFLMELCLPDYAMLHFLPSQQAAASLWLTMKLHEVGSWDAKMAHYSTYSEVDLKPCVKRIAELVMKMGTAKQQAVRSKYCSSKFMRVAKDPMLKSKIISNLASDMWH
jgi:cyclin B